MIRLVLFDAFATLIKPRVPIANQYAEVFATHFAFRQEDIKSSFKSALKSMQVEKPLYDHLDGVAGWWGEVVRRTAEGAGGAPVAVRKSLPTIVPILMKRFSSREGYELYDDVMPALHHLLDEDVRVGVTSNADARVRSVLDDLGVLPLLDPCVLSEEVGSEKPSSLIWEHALKMTGLPHLSPNQVLHVGDELESDYRGAMRTGLSSLLLRRPGRLGDEERKDADENLSDVQIVSGFDEVVSWVIQQNLPNEK